jgi:NTE family protein
MTIRTLVLSGGGGRGAFHAGVYKYLSETAKTGVKQSHSGPWTPDIVVGTSIGAVNGAAIVQGISAAELEAFWLTLRERDVQALPPGMGPLARRIANWLLKRSIGITLRQVPISPLAQQSWPPFSIFPGWLAERLIGRWSNLLDSAPLRTTLTERLKLNPQIIANSKKTLLINATNVRTGEGVIFSNRWLHARSTDIPRGKVHIGITMNRIMASCSIPLLYPWTQDDDGELYWDGALVANTPLSAAFDAVSGHPIDEPMEIVIVLLNPWWDINHSPAPRHQRLPRDFSEAATWTLDWTMQASFRVSMKMLHVFNSLIEKHKQAGLPQTYRYVKDVMVAPDDFLPASRIIDYDEDSSREMIRLGYEAAKKAFQKEFAEEKKAEYVAKATTVTL